MSDYQIEHLQKVPIYFLLFSYYSYTTTLPIQKQKYSFMHHILKKVYFKIANISSLMGHQGRFCYFALVDACAHI